MPAARSFQADESHPQNRRGLPGRSSLFPFTCSRQNKTRTMSSEFKKLPRSEVNPAPEYSADDRPATIDEMIARVVAQTVQGMNLVQKLVVDIDEISEMLGCSISQVHNLVTEGKLTDVSYDRRLRCNIDEVKALVRKKKKAS